MIFVKIKNSFIGFHKYPDAPEEVKFLRDLHRHLFHVVTKISVSDTERELEFFTEQKKINRIIKSLKGVLLENSEMSCELISQYILDFVELEHPFSHIQVETSEDNECSASVDNFENFSSTEL